MILFQTLLLFSAGARGVRLSDSDTDTKITTDATQVAPDTITRFALDRSLGYQVAQISNQIGPQSDGRVDVIDVINILPREIDTSGVDRVLIVRLEQVTLTQSDIQFIGDMLVDYLDQNHAEQFATATIDDIGEGKDLYGKWTTLVLCRDYEGNWSAKDLGMTSVVKQSDGDYGVLKDGKMNNVDGDEIVSTLLIDENLRRVLKNGHTLSTTDAYLVRPPVRQAFAVVARGVQTVYDRSFRRVGKPQRGFTTLAAIDQNGGFKAGKVNTVSGRGNDWDVRHSLPASKADNLGKAYGAQAT